MVWFVFARAAASSAATGLAVRLELNDGQPLLESVLLLFLAAVGVALLRAIERRSGPLRDAVGLPRRATSREEWAMGAAIGWALAVASVLPMLLMRSLNVQLWNAPRAYYLLGLSLLTLAMLTLAQTVVIVGYAFPRLMDALGPTRAALLLIALVAVHSMYVRVPYDTPEGTRALVEILALVLLCLCWLRTHAVWLAWGLHFAWAASTACLFGLPVGGNSSFGSVVDTRAAGPLWLTGGSYGPAAAAFSIVVLIAAILVLMRVTDDYAWEYTRRPIISGGYDVTIAPPAAHVAMEEAAAKPSGAQLVQIQPAVSPSSPADKVPE